MTSGCRNSGIHSPFFSFVLFFLFLSSSFRVFIEVWRAYGLGSFHPRLGILGLNFEAKKNKRREYDRRTD